MYSTREFVQRNMCHENKPDFVDVNCTEIFRAWQLNRELEVIKIKSNRIADFPASDPFQALEKTVQLLLLAAV